MVDNVRLEIYKGDKQVEYKGVVCKSREEASSLLHPDYWKGIPVGGMMIIDGHKKLIHILENLMLIRVNDSRHFIRIDAALEDDMTCFPEAYGDNKIYCTLNNSR